MGRSALLLLLALFLGAAGLEVRAQQVDPAALASFEARLLQLEEELRRLTGRLEEMEFRQRQLEERLRQLEARPAAPPIAAPEPEAEVAEGEPVAAEPRAEGAAAEEERPMAEEQPAADVPLAEAAELAPALAGGPQERYQAALALLEAGRFAQAEEALARLLSDFPDHELAPRAAYWLGETYFFRQDYQAAAQTFARNYRRYGPQAPRAPDTLLKLGMAFAAMGDRERACRTFEELARRHPDAPAPVRQALRRERSAAGCP